MLLLWRINYIILNCISSYCLYLILSITSIWVITTYTGATTILELKLWLSSTMHGPSIMVSFYLSKMDWIRSTTILLWLLLLGCILHYRCRASWAALQAYHLRKSPPPMIQLPISDVFSLAVVLPSFLWAFVVLNSDLLIFFFSVWVVCFELLLISSLFSPR